MLAWLWYLLPDMLGRPNRFSYPSRACPPLHLRRWPAVSQMSLSHRVSSAGDRETGTRRPYRERDPRGSPTRGSVSPALGSSGDGLAADLPLFPKEQLHTPPCHSP